MQRRLQPEFGPGISQTKAGHLRYTGGPNRNKYVHRMVIEDAIKETHPLTLQFLPWPYEVHHMDHCKTHNCRGNLLMVEEFFHSVMTAAGRNRQCNGYFRPKWGKPPEWLPLLDQEEEVPF